MNPIFEAESRLVDVWFTSIGATNSLKHIILETGQSLWGKERTDINENGIV
jgi:hypothetical protein